jgi:hypothetical protein
VSELLVESAQEDAKNKDWVEADDAYLRAISEFMKIPADYRSPMM